MDRTLSFNRGSRIACISMLFEFMTLLEICSAFECFIYTIELGCFWIVQVFNKILIIDVYLIQKHKAKQQIIQLCVALCLQVLVLFAIHTYMNLKEFMRIAKYDMHHVTSSDHCIRNLRTYRGNLFLPNTINKLVILQRCILTRNTRNINGHEWLVNM